MRKAPSISGRLFDKVQFEPGSKQSPYQAWLPFQHCCFSAVFVQAKHITCCLGIPLRSEGCSSRPRLEIAKGWLASSLLLVVLSILRKIFYKKMWGSTSLQNNLYYVMQFEEKRVESMNSWDQVERVSGVLPVVVCSTRNQLTGSGLPLPSVSRMDPPLFQ